MYRRIIPLIAVLLLSIFICICIIQSNLKSPTGADNTIKSSDTDTDNDNDNDNDTITVPPPTPQTPTPGTAATPAPANAETIEIIIPEDSPMEDRITYQPGFYYESLSDSIKSRITGISYPEDCTIPYEDLRYVSVQHYDLDGKEQIGELICNQTIAEDLVEIFYELYQAEYPIEQIRLIDEYSGDDNLSMMDNNTSSFNYRVVEGTTRLSKHALGMAIDINPFYNPYVTYPEGKAHVSPTGAEPYADRTAPFSFKITHEDLAYKLFIEHGFKWGGDWNSVQDYQHFEKDIE